MELDVLEILLGHLKHIARISKEHITSFPVLCHILILTLLECLKFSVVIALHPTCLVETGWFPTAQSIVLVF